MPELPEVETIRKQLNQVLVGKRVAKLQVLREKSFVGKKNEVEGLEVAGVERKAKVIVFRFRNSEKVVICHLKMTGQLIFVDGEKRIGGGHPTADWIRELPSSHTRIIWKFDDGSTLFFNDMRVFGWMKVVKIVDWEKTKGEMPIDVVDPGFTDEYLKQILAKTRREVKLAIMDQKKIGGMGNIYANDALFLAKVKPSRRADSLSEVEVSKLKDAMVTVINRGIKYGGASASDEKYVSTSGMGGTYQNYFQVYERDGEACLVCREKIVKSKLGGRGTYYCPNCQV